MSTSVHSHAPLLGSHNMGSYGADLRDQDTGLVSMFRAAQGSESPVREESISLPAADDQLRGRLSEDLGLPAQVPAAKTDSVWVQAWNNLGCVERFLTIAPLGIPFLFYVAYLAFTGGHEPSAMGSQSVVSEVITRGPGDILKQEEKKVLPPLFTDEPIQIPSNPALNPEFRGFIQERKEAQEGMIAASKVVYESGTSIASSLAELASLTRGSGIQGHEFQKALEEGKPLKSLNLEYYRYIRTPGTNQIPAANKQQIEAVYTSAAESMQKKRDAEATYNAHHAKLQPTLPALNDIFLDGMPYRLSIGEELFRRTDFQRLFKNDEAMPEGTTRSFLESLETWAGGRAHVEELGFRAQQYLVDLASDVPMTLLDDDEDGLLDRGLQLEPTKRGHEVKLEQKEKMPVISSKRVFHEVNERGEVVRRLQWNETIDVTTGDVIRDVTQI